MIAAKQAEISRIDAKYKEVKAKETKKEYSSQAPLFDDDADISMEYINNGETMPYLLIGPENPDPNKELPVIVYLHGSGEVGSGESGLYNGHGPGGFIKDLDLQNFNGYIICPHLTGRYNAKNWINGGAETYLRELLDNFQQNHAVDKNRIALTGGSLGGEGVIYMAKHMGDVFCKAASLSGYPSSVKPSDVDIPLIGIVGKAGSGESESSIKYMRNNFNLQQGDFFTYAQSGDLFEITASHAHVPKVAFGTDSNGNGCSDLIEWLFDENYT